jgi:hypothetical protein
MGGVRYQRRQPVASVWPLVMGTVAFVLGSALAVWTALSAAPQTFVGDVQLPFANVSTFALSLGGYLLTPFVVFVAFIWDRVGQRQGLQDRNFGLKPQYSRALQIMAAVAMVLAVWHVLNIAYAWAGA